MDFFKGDDVRFRGRLLVFEVLNNHHGCSVSGRSSRK